MLFSTTHTSAFHKVSMGTFPSDYCLAIIVLYVAARIRRFPNYKELIYVIKMTDEDVEVIEEPNSDVNFDTWATELGLPHKVTQILRQEELTTKRAITLFETKDLKELGLPLCTIKVIMDELSKLKAPLPSGTATENADTAPIITADRLISWQEQVRHLICY